MQIGPPGSDSVNISFFLSDTGCIEYNNSLNIRSIVEGLARRYSDALPRMGHPVRFQSESVFGWYIDAFGENLLRLRTNAAAYGNYFNQLHDCHPLTIL